MVGIISYDPHRKKCIPTHVGIKSTHLRPTAIYVHVVVVVVVDVVVVVVAFTLSQR